MLIDTHCHLNLSDAFPEPAAAVAEARAGGVERLVVVGIEPESSRRALAITEAHEEVYATVGWHPNSTADYTPGALDELEAMLAHPKAVALGEIGLDFHWDYATREQQERALLDQLALARRMDKPVVLHCREAYPELLDILEGQPGQPLVFHCFTGTAEDATRALALDAYFGVDGPITYKSADPLREVVRNLPPERLLLETDSPFLPPVPFRGKPNRPAYLPLINAALAALLGLSEPQCAALTSGNATRFFRL